MSRYAHDWESRLERLREARGSDGDRPPTTVQLALAARLCPALESLGPRALNVGVASDGTVMLLAILVDGQEVDVQIGREPPSKPAKAQPAPTTGRGMGPRQPRSGRNATTGEE